MIHYIFTCSSLWAAERRMNQRMEKRREIEKIHKRRYRVKEEGKRESKVQILKNKKLLIYLFHFLL